MYFKKKSYCLLPVWHCAPLQSRIPSVRPLSGFTAGTRRHTNKRTTGGLAVCFFDEPGQDLGVAKVLPEYNLIVKRAKASFSFGSMTYFRLTRNVWAGLRCQH